MFDAREWHGKTTWKWLHFALFTRSIQRYCPFNQPNIQFNRWLLLPSEVAAVIYGGQWVHQTNQVHQSTYHAICMIIMHDRPIDLPAGWSLDQIHLQHTAICKYQSMLINCRKIAMWYYYVNHDFVVDLTNPICYPNTFICFLFQFHFSYSQEWSISNWWGNE